MAFKQLISFFKGADSDTDVRLTKSYVKGYNIVVGTSENGNVGSVENIKGNLQVFFYQPNGTNECVGSCKDLENDGIIIFLYNSLGYHSIKRYNITSNTITDIINQNLNQPSIYRVDLAFNPAHLITSCYVVHGQNGSILCWSQDNVPPRKINIDKAIKFNISGGLDPLGYQFIDEQTIDRIKWPPHFSPTCSYQNDYTYNYNNLRGSTFQFAYAYVYDDNEISTASPTSKLPVPQNAETIDGLNNEVENLNNALDITLDTNIPTVKAILLYARSNAETDGTNPITVSANYGSWYLVDRLEKYNIDGTPTAIGLVSTYVYRFYNSKIKNVLNQDDIARLFDYVPLLQGAEEIIEKNRTLVGDITEGYDNLSVDINLYARKVQVDYSQLSTPIQTGTQLGYYNITTVRFKVITMPAVSLGDTIQITYTSNIYDGSTTTSTNHITSHTVTSNDLLNYPQSVCQALYNVIYPNLYCQYHSNYHELWIVDDYYIYVNQVYGSNIIPILLKPLTVFKDWKKGATRQFAINYYDRGNRSGASNTNDNCNVYINLDVEESIAGQDVNYAQRSVIDWQINHKPPIWATHYQWSVAPCTTKAWLDYHLMSQIGADFNSPTNDKNAIHLDTQGFVRLKFNQALIDFATVSPKSILSYVWVKGDRCRFFAKSNAVTGRWTYYYKTPSGSTFNGLPQLDFEIVGYDSGAGELILEPFDISPFLATNDQFAQHSIVEVYTPRKDIGTQIFSEIGECFPIIDAGLPTRAHGGQTQDQTATQPALGTFDSGDAYLKLRWTAVQGIAPPFDADFKYFPCESNNISDFYVSDSTDIGRPNIVDRNMQQRKLKANYRFSNMLVQDTQINGLSRFDVLDAGQLPDKFGAIMRICEVGKVVKVVQNIKTSSIYVGIQKTAESGGASNLYAISGVLGTVEIPDESNGTYHKESVCVHDGDLYWYDLTKGEFMRDAGNGQFPISGYGQKNYFRTWAEQIRNAIKNGGTSKVITAYDKAHEQVNVTLSWTYGKPHELHHDSRQETIAFLEKKSGIDEEMSDQWKTNYDYLPEYYGYSDDAFIAFQNGQLWLQNSNPIHCNFFGVKYSESITFSVSTQPQSIKRFLALMYSSNKVWSAISIDIPASDEYPQGMHSRLKDVKFRVKEGMYYAEFLNDMNTPGITNPLDALLNGRYLRGQSVQITLENSYDDLVVLFEAAVSMNISLPSGLK